MPCLDRVCRLIQPNPASGLDRIDQFRVYSRDYKILKERVCVCVCDSHVGMELFALKHEWLFHGPAQEPCPRLSRPEQEEDGTLPVRSLLV